MGVILEKESSEPMVEVEGRMLGSSLGEGHLVLLRVVSFFSYDSEQSGYLPKGLKE